MRLKLGKEGMVKLNVGCGFDYREGFINIDGSDALPKVDIVIDFDSESILEYFSEGEVDFILANDFIEHHFHWEAIEILRNFFSILKHGGTLQMRLPDFDAIISQKSLTSEEMIALLYGGQDISRSKGDEISRRKFPHFYCHKYGYTQTSMKRELESIGYAIISCHREYKRGKKWIAKLPKFLVGFFVLVLDIISGLTPRNVMIGTNFLVIAEKPKHFQAGLEE